MAEGCCKDEIKILHVMANKGKSASVQKFVPLKLMQNEIYYIIQALLLISLILALSYHGIRYGCIEYSLLANGRIVNGFVPPRKAVVMVSVGYPVPYAIINSITACMLLYSIIWMRPRWSLPLIVVNFSDIVCNIGDVFVAFCFLFVRLPFYTAITYVAAAASIIMGELWIWFGVLRLYDLRKNI